MLRFIVFILFLFLPCTLFLGGKSSDSTPDSAERAAASDVEAYASLYRSMQLEGVVNWKAFRQAVAGYYKNRQSQAGGVDIDRLFPSFYRKTSFCI